jgi:chromosome segregation ATPase
MEELQSQLDEANETIDELQSDLDNANDEISVLQDDLDSAESDKEEAYNNGWNEALESIKSWTEDNER